MSTPTIGVRVTATISDFESKMRKVQECVSNVGKSVGEMSKDFETKMKKISDVAEKTGKSVTEIGEKFSKGVTAPLTLGFGLLTKGTEELRGDMAKFEANVNSAGLSIDTMTGHFKYMTAVTGEADSTIEGLSNLMATGFNETQMLQAIEGLTGAVIKFPDTLKFESLADSIEETVATGSAVGQYGELLERLGYNLDDFNLGLEEATANGTAQQYVLDVLASTGLSNLSSQYNEANKEMLNSAMAQQELNLKLAELGETLVPLLTRMTEFATKMAEMFLSLDGDTQQTIITLLSLVATVGPVLVGIGKLIQFGGLVAKAFSTVSGAIAVVTTGATASTPAIGALASVFTFLTGPVGIVIGVIAGLIAIGVLLWKNWDTIKEKATAIWGAVSSFFSETWDSIKEGCSSAWDSVSSACSTTWDSVSNYLSDKWSSIKENSSNTWNSIKDTISEKWGNVTEACSNTWNNITDYLSDKWNSIVESVKAFFEPVVTFFSDIWNKVYGVTSTIVTFIFQWVTEYIKGIVILIGMIFEPVVEFFKNIWESIKSFAVEKWTQIKDYFTEIWESISNKCSEVWNAIKDFTTQKWNELTEFLKGIWDGIYNKISEVWNSISDYTTQKWNELTTFLTGIWSSISSKCAEVWNAIKSFFTEWYNNVSSFMSSKWEGIKTVVVGVWEGIKTKAGAIWEGVKSVIWTPVQSIIGSVTSAFESMKSKVTSIFESFKSAVLGVWNGIKSGIKTCINGIIGLVNGMIKGINAPGKLLNDITGVNIPMIPTIPYLAKGGVLGANGKAIVGEAGPELVQNIGGKVSVTPLSSQEKAKGITGALGGGGINLNIQNFNNNREQDIEQLCKELEFYRKRLYTGTGGVY